MAKAGSSKSKKTTGSKSSTRRNADSSDAATQPVCDQRSLIMQLVLAAGGLTTEALSLAARTAGAPLSAAKNLLLSTDQINLLKPERLELMRQTGLYLRDLRQVAGLTIDEVGTAVDLKDESVLKAVESGTATLSFELILRLASLLARHDPVPFVIRVTRTYNPDLWRMLKAWGIDRLPLQYERERRFINIYRRHDAARKLSDAGYDQILEFTRSAFEMALHFVAEQEQVEDAILPVDDTGDDADSEAT